MATIRENLVTAREGLAEQLADLSDPTKRRPNYNIAGRSVSWAQYRLQLIQEIRELDELISREDGDDGSISATAIQ